MDIPVNSPQMVVQPKPGFNWWILSTMVLLVLLTVVSVVAFMLWKEKTATNTVGVIPAIVTPSEQTETETVRVTPTVKSIVLKVPAIGGGALGDRYDYEISLAPDPTDVLTVQKYDLSQIKNFPGYAQGATDKALTIKHDNIYMTISPQFEGAGTTPLKQKISPLFVNDKLTNKPIYRVDSSITDIPADDKRGSQYTVSYKEGKGDCSDNGPADPACVWSEGVSLRSGDALLIVCSVEGTAAAWCDNLVKSMSVTVTKFAQ